MPIYKRCRKCGQRIKEGSVCKCVDRRYAEDDKYTSDTKEKKFYKSAEWQKKRIIIAERFANLDIYSYFKFNRIEPGETVHHIVPLEDDWSLRLESNNLIYLTEKNHRIIHAAMKSSKVEYERVIKELRELLVKAQVLFDGGGI